MTLRATRSRGSGKINLIPKEVQLSQKKKWNGSFCRLHKKTSPKTRLHRVSSKIKTSHQLRCVRSKTGQLGNAFGNDYWMKAKFHLLRCLEMCYIGISHRRKKSGPL